MVAEKDTLYMTIVALDGGTRKSGSKTSRMEEEAYSYRRDTDVNGKYPIFYLFSTIPIAFNKQTCMPLETVYKTFHYKKLVGVVIRSRTCKKMSLAKINRRPPSDSAPVGVSLRETCRSRIWKPSGSS